MSTEYIYIDQLTSAEDAKSLRALIDAYWLERDQVTLNFSGVSSLTDEIARILLIPMWGDFQTKMRFAFYNPTVTEVIQYVVAEALLSNG